jgi:hypothetical protein
VTRTRALTLSLILQLCLLAGLVALLLVARASAAPSDTCDPADTAQCCACEPSQAAEPAPLPRLYLPSVMQRMPSMSAEFTPAQPVATPEPEVPVSGDASQ